MRCMWGCSGAELAANFVSLNRLRAVYDLKSHSKFRSDNFWCVVRQQSQLVSGVEFVSCRKPNAMCSGVVKTDRNGRNRPLANVSNFGKSTCVDAGFVAFASSVFRALLVENGLEPSRDIALGI